jgi:superfamily II DNA or RNA helicase
MSTAEARQRPRVRWYQAEGIAAVHKSHETNNSTLVVAATGTGKSVLFAEVADKHLNEHKRVLCLAHRKELVQQNANTLQWVTGEMVDVEMAEEYASNRARVVSASVQTLAQTRRLERWDPNHFALVIADEAHHFSSPTFKKILDYFTGAKILGVTATPDRGDEKALGKVFGDVAFVFDIVDGIDQGYLVPIVGRSVEVQDIDLSVVGKTAGDLAAGELDDEMVRHVEGIVQKTLELEPDRQGIWFWPGVKSAELACDRINALRPGACAFVSGETPKDEREVIFRDFKRGVFQHLSNCAVVVEGTDLPSANMVVMGRPTLSRAFYAQAVGRGLRPQPGLVDHVEGQLGAAERRGLIAGSLKPNCAVIDFGGNAGKHVLVTPEDILGGDYSDEEITLAKKVAKEAPGQDVLANLEAARKELKAMMARLQSKVKATVQSFNPFEVLAMAVPDAGAEKFREEMTPAQVDRLGKHNIKPAQMKGLSKLEAQRLLGSLEKRRNLGLCSFNQLRVLKAHCNPPTNLPFRQASKAMQYIADSNWKPDREVLQAMVARK